MALKHAILVALSRGVPQTGYELNASFSDENDRSWRASPSQVYSELTKMESSGLIEIIERNERGRTSYAITEPGREELKRWLVHDEPYHGLRDEMSLRLFTMWILDDTNARYAIEAEISFQRKRQLKLIARLETYDDRHEDSRIWRNRRSLAMLWLAQTNLMLDWLDGLLEVLEHPERSVTEIFDAAGVLPL